MEEKETIKEKSSFGFPGGHNLLDDNNKCCPVSSTASRRDDGGGGGGGLTDFKKSSGGQCSTLPRYSRKNGDSTAAAADKNGQLPRHHDVHVSGRKVDSLPTNITMFTLEHDRKSSKRKGVLKSVGSFIQKIARHLSSSAAATGGGLRIRSSGGGLNRSSASTTSSSNNSGCNNNHSNNNLDCLMLGHHRSGSSSAAGSSNAIGPSSASNSGHSQQQQQATAAAAEPSCRYIILDEVPGTVGIHNHGNTCFMNAIVQCLSNTEPLLGYFLSDQYKEDIKRANKHNAKRFGTKGELTEHLATLLKSLWLKTYTPEVSTEFKATVSKYGSQYRGSFQHDVQEFLMWLLDKVHEDLNIATKKKYRANKSSYGRSDDEVAAEAMANHARCNNSFIHDLFQALYRSSLTCPRCQHQSNTFDPFLSVSLPIPGTSSVQPVLVTSCCGSRGHDGQSVWRRVGIILEKGHLVGDLKAELIKEGMVLQGLDPSELLIIEVTRKSEFRILDDSRLLNDPPTDDLTLYAIAISGKSRLQATHEPGDLLSASAANGEGIAHSDSSPIAQNATSKEVEPRYVGRPSLNECIPEERCSDGRTICGRAEAIEAELNNGDKLTNGAVPSVAEGTSDREKSGEPIPGEEELLVLVLNSVIGRDDERRLSVPYLFSLPEKTTVGHFDFSVKNHFQLDATCKYYAIVEERNSRSQSSRVELNAESDEDKPLVTAEEVKRSLFHPTPASNNGGCKTVPPIMRLLVEWDDSSVYNCFNFLEDADDDSSVEKIQQHQRQSDTGTLDECFQVYTQEEMLGEDNAWHCPNCQNFQQGTTKSLTLWSLPEILVIHLKRFRQDSEQRSKLNALILFPITGLDLRLHMPRRQGVNGGDAGSWNATMQQKSSKQQSTWLSWRLGCKTSADDDEEALYDLYAVCNHYGDMQGGHYTAFCRNPVSSTWCLYNDSRATPMSEDEVVTRAAYLLFYQRRNSSNNKPNVANGNNVTNGINVTNGNSLADGSNNPDSCSAAVPVVDSNGTGDPGSVVGSNGDADGRALDSLPSDGDDGSCHAVARPAKSLTAIRDPTRTSPHAASSSASLGPACRQPVPVQSSADGVAVPLSSIESRPWLVSLLEERHRLHGLLHTIAQVETSRRISRAITSHSLDDLLDGDCDEPHESYLRDVPVYTTLRPPLRITKQSSAKAPLATISTDSVPTAAVGETHSTDNRSSSERDAKSPAKSTPTAPPKPCSRPSSASKGNKTPEVSRPTSESPAAGHGGNGSADVARGVKSVVKKLESLGVAGAATAVRETSAGNEESPPVSILAPNPVKSIFLRKKFFEGID